MALVYDKDEEVFRDRHHFLFTPLILAGGFASITHFYGSGQLGRKFSPRSLLSRVGPKSAKAWLSKFLDVPQPVLPMTNRIVEAAAEHRKSLARIDFLTKVDLEQIGFISKTLVGPTAVEELTFKKRVLRRYNPVLFDQLKTDPASLDNAFREYVEVIDKSKNLQNILKEELVRYEARKVKSYDRLAVLADKADEIQTARGRIEQLVESWEKHPDAEARRLAQALKRLPMTVDDFRVPKDHASAIKYVHSVINITDPKARMVPLSQTIENAGIKIEHTNFKSTLSKLSTTGADSGAVAFLKSFDNEIRSQLNTIHVKPRVTYHLENTFSDFALNVRISVRTTQDAPRKIIRMRIPLTKGGIARIHGSQWIMQGFRDWQPVHPGIKRMEVDYYGRLFQKIQTDFIRPAWNKFLSNAPGESAAGQMEINDIVNKTFDRSKELMTAQPFKVGITETVFKDAHHAALAGKFEGERDRFRLENRYDSMRRLKLLMQQHGGKVTLPRKYAFLDFETFGKSAGRGGKQIPHSVTVGIVEEGKIVDWFTTSINPRSIDKTYAYPENDLNLLGKPRPRIIEELNRAPSVKDVSRRMENFLANHAPKGGRIPVAAWNAGFDVRRVLHIPQLSGVLRHIGDVWDPMDLTKALVSPSQSVSLLERGAYRKWAKRARGSPHVTKKFVDLIRGDRGLMKILKEKDPGAYELIAKAVTAADYRNLALHEASIDVLLAQKEFQAVVADLNRHSEAVQVRLNKTLMQMRYALEGYGSNPIAFAHSMVRGASKTYYSLSLNSLLQGKFTNFDAKDLLPLAWAGVDPTRPFGQRFTVGRLSEKVIPGLVTKLHKRIAEKYGEGFRTVDILDIHLPGLDEGAILADVKSVGEKLAIRDIKTIRIPKTDTLKLQDNLSALLEEVSDALPEDRGRIIKKYRQEIGRSVRKLSKHGGWYPKFHVLAEDATTTYTTESPLYSTLENIEYNTEKKEIIIKLATADKPSIYGHPMKLFVEEGKGMATMLPHLRAKYGVDMLIDTGGVTRGRLSFIMSQIMRITNNLQHLHRYMGKDKDFERVVQEFMNRLNSKGGIKLRKKLVGGELQFVDMMDSKLLKNIDATKANWINFTEGEWVSFMKEFSNKIQVLRTKGGVRFGSSDPRLPYWTPDSLETMFKTEYEIDTKGRLWNKASADTKKTFIAKWEREMYDVLSSKEFSNFMSKAELERWKSGTLKANHLAILQRVGQTWGMLKVSLAGRAFEWGEVFARSGTMAIPSLDELMVPGEGARKYFRQHTPAQLEMISYMMDTTPTLVYGVPPSAKLGMPILKSSEISIDKFMDSPQMTKELASYLGKSTRIECLETGEIFGSIDEMPDAYKKAGYGHRKLNLQSYMNIKMMGGVKETEGIYGRVPTWVEFDVGGRKTYIPRPGLPMIRTAPAPITLPSGERYVIAGKETVAFLNVFNKADAWERAIGEETKRIAEEKFFASVDSYKAFLLSNKTAMIDATRPTVPGVQGKAHWVMPPGYGAQLGLDAAQTKHITAGYGVQAVSLETMGEDVFDKTIETHKILTGAHSGKYRGGTLSVYNTKEEMRKAILEGEEVLVHAIQRIPAESKDAIHETLLSVRKQMAAGVGLQTYEAYLTRFDFDGDLARTLVANMPSEEKEQLMRILQSRQLRERRAQRGIVRRIYNLQTNIEEFEATEDPHLRSSIEKEVKELESLEKRHGVHLTGQGAWVKSPVTGTNKEIRLGYGMEERFYRMGLHKFSPDLPALGVPRELMTDPVFALQKQVAQALTKTGTGPAFTKTRSMLASIGLFLPDKLKGKAHDTVAEIMGQITKLKKHPLDVAERVVSGLLNIGTPASMAAVREVMPEVPESILESLKYARMKLGEGAARPMINAMISANMSKVPLTAAQLDIMFGRSAPRYEISHGLRGVAENLSKEHIYEGIKKHSKKAGLALLLAGIVAPMFLPHDNVYDKQGYPIISTKFNAIQPSFPAPIHLTPNDVPSSPVQYLRLQPPDPLYMNSGLGNRSEMRKVRNNYPNPLRN